MLRTVPGGDGPELGAAAALEQQRGRGWPDVLVAVVAGGQRDLAAGSGKPGDDRGEHIGQVGRDDQEPLGAGLGRGDLQQRHQFAGGRQPVLDQAVVGELEQLLAADAGGAQHLDDRPRPEGVVFFPGQVAVRGVGAGSPYLHAGFAGGDPGEGVPGDGERAAGRGMARRVQHLGGARPVLGSRASQDGQDREPFPDTGVHPGLAAPVFLAAVDVGLGDRAGHGPRSPAGRVLGGPAGQVQVERADRGPRLLVHSFEHAVRRVVGQRPRRAAQRPPQRLPPPGRDQRGHLSPVEPQPHERIRGGGQLCQLPGALADHGDQLAARVHAARRGR
jgi:hypothetical protein